MAGKNGRLIEVPPIEICEIKLRLIGDRPLMLNNKMNVAADIAAMYSGIGKTAHVRKIKDSEDVQYAKAFYVMPSSKEKAPSPKALYGLPASGIKKCIVKGIRPAGIQDNNTVGQLQKAFFVKQDEGGLCRLYFKKLERDIRPVNVGKGAKTVPQMRHRPLFHDWYVDILVSFNPKLVNPEQLVNLAAHAGQYIGLHELRAEKNQGECGGFLVQTVPNGRSTKSRHK